MHDVQSTAVCGIAKCFGCGRVRSKLVCPTMCGTQQHQEVVAMGTEGISDEEIAAGVE